jgi:pimeloyl-ACP methyl ester carboxylesterase
MVDTVRVPTLAITGEKDLFTPLETSRSIVDRIPGAELMVVQGGTHYTPVEFPMVVNLRIEKFLRERLGMG